ncbi:MAG: pimeloyl-ACP methyl ester carboxylesterase [Phycisphaerales bacterium]|jgi:pimeloyl-ACP methyl ester carboxylesterase
MRHAKTLKVPLTLALIMWAQEGCGLPGPTADPSKLEGLTRSEVAVSRASGDGYHVSVLAGGDPTMPRVIYVHGTPGDAANWLDYLDEPVAGWEAIALDRPGFGQSGPGRSVVTLEDQARALEPLLVKRRGVKPILVGHSLGGPIVAKAALLYPDRVGAIVIAAGALDPALEKVLFIQSLGNTVMLSWILPKWAKHSNEELISLEDELLQMQPHLGDIACPIVVIHGTDDKLVPYDNVGFMRTNFLSTPAAEFITLEEGNHFLIWNQPDRTREAITRAMELMGADGLTTPMDSSVTDTLGEPAHSDSGASSATGSAASRSSIEPMSSCIFSES